MHEPVMTVLAGIGLISIACQWFAWRVKLPAILFLLIAGIVAGPVIGWLNPDDVFGPLLMPITALSVAVILFEGSLTLKFHEIRGLQKVIRRLVTTGLLITWVIVALATHWALSFSWNLSFLFGAITVVTGPTVIVPLLRTVRPTANVANILRWEGIVIDPLGALLGILVFQFIISEADGEALGKTFLNFFKALGLSSAIGCVVGYGFGFILRRHWLPDFLHNVTALTLVFGTFVVSNWIQRESGFLAVTVMGIWLANMKRVPIEDILNFKESLSILLISGLFVILAARINFTRFGELGWGAAAVFLAVQFLAQPFKALVSAWGSSLTWRERLLIAWIGPRGIVAAATAAVFAARLQEHGYEAAKMTDAAVHLALTTEEYLQAELLVPLTFMVIIGTVVLQSATARLLALRLGVAEPEAKGFLIVGANIFAREVGKMLRDCGFNVLLADANADNVRAARMEGLETYYGNVVSQHADRHLDLVGIGHLLALSEHQEINHLACQRYRAEFGRRAIYMVQAGHQGDGASSRFVITAEGRLLFGAQTDFRMLLQWVRDGAKLHKTVLTEQYDFETFLMSHQERAVPLFAMTPKGHIRFFGVDERIVPHKDWTLVSLVRPESPPGSKVR